MSNPSCPDCSTPQIPPGAAPDHQASAALPASATAPATARHWVRHTLRSWGVPDDTICDAELCVDELATNAYAHSGTADIDVTVQTTGRRVHLGVVDHGHAGAVPGLRADMPDPLAERGRGMPIVAALASGLEVHTHPDGGTHASLNLEAA